MHILRKRGIECAFNKAGGLQMSALYVGIVRSMLRLNVRSMYEVLLICIHFQPHHPIPFQS